MEVGSAFIGETVLLRESAELKCDLDYCWKKLGAIDLKKATTPKGYQNALIEEG